MTGHEAASELIRQLGSGSLRRPIGVLQVPPRWCARAGDLAVRLGVDYVDLRARLVEQLHPNQHTLGWSWEALAAQLMQIAAQRPEVGSCTLIGNLDLVLARFRVGDCAHWWRSVHVAGPRYGLLLVLPTHAEQIFPEEERAVWRDGGRLVEWTDQHGGL